MHEDGTRSSSQSHQGELEDSQRSSVAFSRSRPRDHRHYRNHVRSPTDRSSTVRTSRPYAAGVAAQLSQRRKQLEARAKEKLKMEQENVVKSPAVGSECTKVERHSNSPSVKEKNERKVVIEIHDDDEQDMIECQKESNADLPAAVPEVSVKTDDTALKDDVDTSTTDSTPVSSSDASSAQNDSCKSDAGLTLDSLQASTDYSAAKPASATVSLMNLPMPPVESESDSEVTPASTEEQL